MTYPMVDQASIVSDVHTTPRDSTPSTCRFSAYAETALPLAAVAIGIVLILGPLLATVVRSTLYWGDKSPLIPAVIKRGEKFHPNSKWFCLMSNEKFFGSNSSYFGKLFAARLKASSEFGFRVDVNRFDPVDANHIFSILSWLSGDPSFLGYPYPLAAAHNLARITLSEIEDIKYKLQSSAFEKGISQDDWDLLFSDFHEILNADLNR